MLLFRRGASGCVAGQNPTKRHPIRLSPVATEWASALWRRRGCARQSGSDHVPRCFVKSLIRLAVGAGSGFRPKLADETATKIRKLGKRVFRHHNGTDRGDAGWFEPSAVRYTARLSGVGSTFGVMMKWNVPSLTFEGIERFGVGVIKPRWKRNPSPPPVQRGTTCPSFANQFLGNDPGFGTRPCRSNAARCSDSHRVGLLAYVETELGIAACPWAFSRPPPIGKKRSSTPKRRRWVWTLGEAREPERQFQRQSSTGRINESWPSQMRSGAWGDGRRILVEQVVEPGNHRPREVIASDFSDERAFRVTSVSLVNLVPR